MIGGEHLNRIFLQREIMKPNTNQKDKSAKSLPKVSHYGTIKVDDLALDCVVLENGHRGYVQTKLLQAIGFKSKNLSLRFRHFLAEVAPNALVLIDKSESPVIVMPSGGHANFLPTGILPEIASGVINHALAGTLHTQRHH